MLPSVTQVSHHVWLNLETLKFYCLPDNYEIIDPSLEDIKVCLISFLPFFLSLLLPSPPSSPHLSSFLLPSSPSFFPSPLLLPSLFVILLFFSPLLVFHLPLHLPYNVHLSLSSSLLSAVRGISNILSGACAITAPVQETLHCTGWNKVSPRHRGPQQHQSKGRPL